MHGLIFETSVCYWQNQPGYFLTLRLRSVSSGVIYLPSILTLEFEYETQIYSTVLSPPRLSQCRNSYYSTNISCLTTKSVLYLSDGRIFHRPSTFASTLKSFPPWTSPSSAMSRGPSGHSISTVILKLTA